MNLILSLSVISCLSGKTRLQLVRIVFVRMVSSGKLLQLMVVRVQFSQPTFVRCSFGMMNAVNEIIIMLLDIPDDEYIEFEIIENEVAVLKLSVTVDYFRLCGSLTMDGWREFGI